MSRLHLERALYRLSLGSPLTEDGDPAAALHRLEELSQSDAAAALWSVDLRLDLDAEERRMVSDGDVAEMYRRGVHPNIIRNFAGLFGIDYVARYREAGLR